MIEPYTIDNSNLNATLGVMMEKTFHVAVIIITVWIFISLIIWLIRKLYKVRKSN